MEWLIGLICLTCGFLLGIFAASLFFAAAELDRLEEYEHKIAGR